MRGILRLRETDFEKEIFYLFIFFSSQLVFSQLVYIPDPSNDTSSTTTKSIRETAAQLMCSTFNTDKCGEKQGGKTVDEAPVGVRGGDPTAPTPVAPTLVPNQVNSRNSLLKFILIN